MIDFGISCDVREEFKEAVRRVPEKEWRRMRKKDEKEYTQEWAEVAYTSWNISVLAMNVNSIMKRYFLPEGYENVRMKIV